MTTSILPQKDNSVKLKSGLIDAIKSKATLSDVIRHFGGAELSGKGDKLVGWHKAHESTSKNSLHVDDKLGLYHCFNCGASGDTINWVGQQMFGPNYSNHDKEQFIEAVGALCEWLNIDMPRYDRQAVAERRSIEEIWQIAADFYHDQLSDEHRAYFRGRGFTDETISSLKLGYAPEGYNTLLKYLVGQGIDGGELLKSGLFHKSEKGNISDVFQGRLMFPYLRAGRVVYFIGRITDKAPAWEREKGMKYKKLLVHNESHPYVSEQVRNDYFYGEDAVRGAKSILVTEGVADCIMALQEGFACISPVTVRFREADYPRLLELVANVDTVYICNDNEDNNAGGKGTMATARMLWEAGKMAKIVTLPRSAGVSKVDLNDYLMSEGAAAFGDVLSKSKNLLEMKVAEAIDADRGDERIAAQKEIVKLLGYVRDEYVLEHWKQSLPKVLNIGARAFSRMLNNARMEAEMEAPTGKRGAADEWIAYMKSLGHTFAMNQLEDTVEMDGKRIGDITRSQLYLAMQDMGVPKTYVDDVINVIAAENTYHPVKAYLTGLKWDGKDHLTALLNHIEGDGRYIDYKRKRVVSIGTVSGSDTITADEYDPADYSPVHWVMIIRWLLGCVAKVFEQESGSAVKHQTPVLVFVGGQGKGKSTLVKWLASGIGYEFHQEGFLDPHKPEDKRSAVTKWIWEISELGGSLRRSDRDSFKAFVTQMHHTYRKPWGRDNITRPALCCFAGTVNDAAFLDDPTGHRRFLPIKIGDIDWKYTSIDVNQLWAQIVHMYLDGQSPELTPVEKVAIEQNREEHELENPMQHYIRKFFIVEPGNEDLKCFTGDIILRLQQFKVNLPNDARAAGRAIADVLTPMGLERKRFSLNGVQDRGWVGIAPNDVQPGDTLY